MTARRETTGSNEAGIELILGGLTTDKTDDGTDVVNLGRPLGIHAGAVVGTDYCIAGIEQCLHNGAQVGSSFAIVAEPSTAIDMNDYRISIFLLLGQIDVTGMIGLVITSIVDILPLLGRFKVGLRFLETAEAAEALGLRLRYANE